MRSAHLAVMAAFVMAGVTFASWASRIPDVKDSLDLTPSRLGLVLIAMSAGSVLALPSAGAVINRAGVARTVLGGTVLVDHRPSPSPAPARRPARSSWSRPACSSPASASAAGTSR